MTVARENKRLKKDLDALNDDGFWDELEEMKVSARDAMGLLGEAQASLRDIYAAYPSLQPSDILYRIDAFMRPGARSA